MWLLRGPLAPLQRQQHLHLAAQLRRGLLASSAALALCVCENGCGETGKPHVAATPTPPHLARLDLLAGRPGGKGWVDGALVDAEFTDPWAVAGDGRGHIYVADANAIRAIDVGEGGVTTLAGIPGTVGSSDGAGPDARFSKPSGLVFAGGQLYVADSENDTIRRVDVQTGVVTTIAGAAGQEQTIDGIGTDARFRVPEGLATDGSGRLYVGDTESHVIRKVDLQTGAVSTVAGSAGASGKSDGVGAAALFDKPKAIAVDGAGSLFVVDSLNGSVRRVDPTTGAVTTLATLDAPPLGIAVDGSDVLVSVGNPIGNNHRIARVAADGTMRPVAGSSGPPDFVDGSGVDARFDGPAGMWNDGAGTVYVADNGNYVLRAIALAGPSVSTLAGARSLGHVDGAPGQARFAAPQGLAVDDDAAVFVADTGNHVIRRVGLTDGAVTTVAGAATQPGLVDGALVDARFKQPQGLALDAATRRLYVADTGNRAIRVVDLGAGKVTTLVPRAAPGSPFGGLDAPSGLALDRGRLFVTDYADDVVVEIDLQANLISTLAGQFAVPARVDGVGTGAGFYGPFGITADGRGHLYVADYLDQTVRSVDIATATVSTLAGEPVIAGTSDGDGVAAHFHFPTGIAADAFGDVFVSDAYNAAVRHIDVSSAAVTTVIGGPSASGVRLGALPAQLAQPSALALTPSGALLVVSQNAILIAH